MSRFVGIAPFEQNLHVTVHYSCGDHWVEIVVNLIPQGYVASITKRVSLRAQEVSKLGNVQIEKEVRPFAALRHT